MSETRTILGKIDVTKIDKEKLFKGKKGTYLDIVFIPTPDSQYGDDYMIVQGVTKEEREAGKRGEILGNAQLLKRRTEGGAPANTETKTDSSGIDEDVPF